LVGKLSVRNRVILLAAIPVIGFLANGAAFTTGEADVADAFASVQHAAGLADHSQDFKGALASMRLTARDFVARPRRELINAFEAANALAASSLTTIEAAVDAGHRKNLEPLRNNLAEVAIKYSL